MNDFMKRSVELVCMLLLGFMLAEYCRMFYSAGYVQGKLAVIRKRIVQDKNIISYPGFGGAPENDNNTQS